MAPQDRIPGFPFRPSTHPLGLSAEGTALSRHGPVSPVRLPGGQDAWFVTGHRACQEVFRDEAAFRRGDADAIAPFPALQGLVLVLDGPEHRGVRRLVSDRFTPAAVEPLRPRVRRVADRLVDGIAAHGGPVDLVAALALPLPLTVIGDLMDVPEKDRDRLRYWGDGLLSPGGGGAAAQAATTAIVGYMAALLAERRADPGDDLVSLIAVRAREAGIDDLPAALLAVALIVAGWETTAGALATFVYTLLTERHPDGGTLYRFLHEHPEHVPSAVEELLRFLPNSVYAAAQPRRAACPVDLGGTAVAAGDVVIPALDHAGRDPAEFPDPERLDLTRTPNRHLAFGLGPHVCLGAALARQELQVALAALTRRLPDLELAVPPGELDWTPETMIRRPRALPVRWKGAMERCEGR
ncbi:cytochrome P450 [Actinomadura macrotermitis]|uniref:cytochrome P450 n=1 Tax=Actinomadura macrotermitis TaxID=2585200 RepID=UPI0012960962|nr:cytochrome P450 [Actinomadura macrotermitis]